MPQGLISHVMWSWDGPGFLPDHDKIIVATKMLNHREFQKIEFTAPSVPGDYDFLCTFPLHGMTMRGVMRVGR